MDQGPAQSRDADASVPTGRLTDAVPATGEAFHAVAELGGTRIEHIVSSDTPDPGEQVQGWDEWVLVVRGSARLEVAGVERSLGSGDWLLIPAGTRHRVLSTQPGTHWIAVHAGAPMMRM
jgi:mannose-6-phosphate isomerase-like protein (cupin superfamily)